MAPGVLNRQERDISLLIECPSSHIIKPAGFLMMLKSDSDGFSHDFSSHVPTLFDFLVMSSSRHESGSGSAHNVWGSQEHGQNVDNILNLVSRLLLFLSLFALISRKAFSNFRRISEFRCGSLVFARVGTAVLQACGYQVLIFTYGRFFIFK